MSLLAAAAIFLLGAALTALGVVGFVNWANGL